jgi:hypothetical protein
MLCHHPPQSVATINVHLDQCCQNLHPAPNLPAELPLLSVNPTNPTYPADLNAASNDASQLLSECTTFCYAACMPTDPTSRIFTNQMGHFILPASTSNTQLFILYDYDTNSIHAEPMPSKSGAAILAAYKTVQNSHVCAGLHPKLQHLNNACPAVLKEFLHDEHITFQLVPPGINCTNAAEHTIRTFKNHFIAGLCSTDPDFLLHLWDRLLEQAILTLNLMCGSRINPQLLAWAQVYRHHDFNGTLIAPPGTCSLVDIKPNQGATWSSHAEDGWYVGPALEHYHCYHVWMWATKHKRNPDILTWFPRHVTMLLASSIDLA